jgi:NADH:ubiquinone oxidoreductase subunit C
MTFLISNFMKGLLTVLPIYYYYYYLEQLFFYVSLKNKNRSLFFLRKHTGVQYKILTDIVCINLFEDFRQFDILYNLLSIFYNHRIFMKVRFPIGKKIVTVLRIYLNSNWMEREIFEMFGIIFYNHPDLRKLLSDFFFEEYPLKKDFSVIGVKEICFRIKATEYQNINFQQKNRVFI